MNIIEHTNIETNCRRIFSTKKLRGGQRSPAASSAHLPAVKFSSSLPPMFSWYLCFFSSLFWIPPFDVAAESLESWSNLKNFRACVFNLLCQPFPKPLLMPQEASRLWTRLSGWVVDSSHLLVFWFLRKSQAGSTRLDSGRWSPHSAQHATCSNNTYRLVHM